MVHPDIFNPYTERLVLGPGHTSSRLVFENRGYLDLSPFTNQQKIHTIHGTGMSTYIWSIFMVNVGKKYHTLHGMGNTVLFEIFSSQRSPEMPQHLAQHCWNAPQRLRKTATNHGCFIHGDNCWFFVFFFSVKNPEGHFSGWWFQPTHL